MDDTSPIEKKIDLKASAEKAFHHFTESIGLWWPSKDHSLSQERAKSVAFEGRAGGRIYEIDVDGKEREWGTVSVYDPCRLLVFSWVLEQPDRATEVEVQFEPTGDNSCTMTLIHRGWETHPEGALWRGNYNNGWEGVLYAYDISLKT